MMNNTPALDSSFRDPSGFLFKRDGVLYRQVNQIYAENYTRLMDSGLYAKLAGISDSPRHVFDLRSFRKPEF